MTNRTPIRRRCHHDLQSQRDPHEEENDSPPGALFLFPFFLFPSAITLSFPWPIKEKAERPTKKRANHRTNTRHRFTSPHQTSSTEQPNLRDLGATSLSRQFVTPYYKFSASNTSSSKLDVGTFSLNQYNPCVLLAHYPGQTHNIQIY